MSSLNTFTTLRPALAYHKADCVSLETFTKDVTLALQNCLPTGIKPYASVDVLFVTWKSEDQACTNELLDVNTVFRARGYRTDHIYLPDYQPLAHFQERLVYWRKGDKSVLKILFYSGHGVAGNNGQCILAYTTLHPYFC
jgi:hypothetical protein